MITFNISISGLAESQVKILSDKLDAIVVTQTKEINIMADLQTDLDAIEKATTAQGTVLAAEGVTLQKISDEVDALLTAVKNGTVTAAQLAQADKLVGVIDAMSKSMDAQAAFSTAIAAKGGPVVPPTPVPSPTPAPDPTPVP